MAVVVAQLTSTGRARAQQGAPLPPAPAPEVGSRSLTIRLELPASGLLLASGGGHFDGFVRFVGGSISLRTANLIELEAGVGILANPCVGGKMFTVRGGVAKRLISAPAGQRGWAVHAPLLVGLHVFRAPPGLFGGCDTAGESDMYFASLAAGLEAKYGTQPAGFTVRLLGFGGPGTKQDNQDYSPPAAAYATFFYGLTLDLGFAFNLH